MITIQAVNAVADLEARMSKFPQKSPFEIAFHPSVQDRW